MERRRARRRRGRSTRAGYTWRQIAFLGVWFASAFAGLVWLRLGSLDSASPDIPTDPRELVHFRRGEALYAQHCASCHGVKLEGEPDWQRPRPDGTYPAPPHDGSGHTWHHPDARLLEMVRDGGQASAMPGVRSRMPGFKGVLSDDEIRTILSFIKRHWSARERAHQAGVTRARDR